MKKWMIVVALVIGILIGSLIGNPIKGEAVSGSDIEFGSKHGVCFAVFKNSITFVRMGKCPK